MSLSATPAEIRPAPLSLAHPQGTLVHRLLGGMMREWQAFRAARALDALDDRALDDLGLSRALIDHVVRYGRAPKA